MSAFHRRLKAAPELFLTDHSHDGYSKTYIKGSFPAIAPTPLLSFSPTKTHIFWMASNHVCDALIPYTTEMNITTPENLHVSRPHGKWALILGSLLNPSPGQTLGRVYTSLGRVLETQANRAAYRLGLGPHVVAQKLKSYFGMDEERVQHLELLRSSIPRKVEKNCWRLIKYALPCVCPTCPLRFD
jgi:hypothetical protein